MAEGRVARNTAYLLTAFVGQKLLSFLYFTIVARAVGVQGSGRYFLAVSFTTIFSIFVDLGLSNILVRESAKHPDRTGQLFGNVLGIKAALAGATVVAVQVMAWILRYPAETRLMIGIASVVMVLDSIHLVFYAVMRGFQNLRYEAIGVVTGQAVTISAGILFVKSGLPLPWLVVALLCGSTWNVIWAWWAIRKFHIRPTLQWDPAIVKFFWTVLPAFALAGIFSRVYSYIDSVILSKLVSETAVGLYGVAYKVAFAFQFLPMAFAAAIYPAMSEYYVKDREKLARAYETAILYLLMVATPIAFGISVLADPIIAMVYGPAFAGSAMPLKILILSLFFAFLYWPAGSMLNACDRQAKNTAAMGVTMVSNIILNFLLVPRFAQNGAAFAALIGNAILCVLAMRSARDLVTLHPERVFGRAARIVGSGVAMSATAVIFEPIAGLLLTIPLAAAVYVGGLFATKAVTKQEIAKLGNVFLGRGKGVSDIVA